MLKLAVLFIALAFAITAAVADEDSEFVSARIESCKGCQLNRLPDVKKFIYNDVPKYENVEFKPINGAPPELVLLNKNDEQVERIPLSHLNREECNELLQGKGFRMKTVEKEL